MSASFSLYVASDSRLHRLHPLTKLSLAAFLLVLSLILPGIGWHYLLVGLVLVPLAAWGGFARRLLNGAIKTTLPFAISLFLIQGLFWGSGPDLVALGPLALKLDGLAFAARSTGRILTIVASFLLLTYSTRPDGLMLALSQRGVPKGIAYIMLTTMQIVPRFQAKANTILDAQRSRGLETSGNLWRRARALLPLIQPLVLGSILDIEERAVALEVRAFGRPGPKSSLLTLVDTAGQRALRRLLLLGAVAAVALRLTGLWLNRG